MEMLLRRRSVAVALVLLLGCIFEAEAGQGSCRNASTQLDTLLAEYDRETAPAPGETLYVQLSLDVSHAAVRDDTGVVRVLADFHMKWTDSRLSWNATEWECEWALTSAERLWVPDVVLINADATINSEEPLRARLGSDGSVQWAQRLDVSVPVTLQLEAWPADEQTAALSFASRTQTTYDLDFRIHDALYTLIFEAGEWEAVSLISTMSSLEDVGQLEAEARRVASWTLRLKRRAPAQVLAARAALTAAALLLAAAALLPPTARTPLTAAAALVTALWLSSISWRVSHSSSTPRVVSCGGGLCALAGTAALSAGLCARLARCRRPAPSALRDLLHAASKYWLIAPQPEGCGENVVWISAARLLDALLLLLLALALLVLLALAF